MSDTAANQPEPERPAPATIAEILRDLEPMGDLKKFVIEDLTPEEEEEFFHILEDA